MGHAAQLDGALHLCSLLQRRTRPCPAQALPRLRALGSWRKAAVRSQCSGAWMALSKCTLGRRRRRCCCMASRARWTGCWGPPDSATAGHQLAATPWSKPPDHKPLPGRLWLWLPHPRQQQPAAASAGVA